MSCTCTKYVFIGHYSLWLCRTMLDVPTTSISHDNVLLECDYSGTRLYEFYIRRYSDKITRWPENQCQGIENYDCHFCKKTFIEDKSLETLIKIFTLSSNPTMDFIYFMKCIYPKLNTVITQSDNLYAYIKQEDLGKVREDIVNY